MLVSVALVSSQGLWTLLALLQSYDLGCPDTCSFGDLVKMLLKKKKSIASISERQNLTGRTKTCSHFKWPSFANHPLLCTPIPASNCGYSLVLLGLAACAAPIFISSPNFPPNWHLKILLISSTGPGWPVLPDFETVHINCLFWPAGKSLWILWL